MDDSSQVILIGLDGLGISAVGEWIEDGTLSTLQSLSNEGTLAELESTIPPWTPCAWPSLLSGRDPGEHGVFDFFTKDGYERSFVDRTDVRAPYLWEVADELGMTTLSINFPVTHPVYELENGAIVPGYLAPEDVTFFPPGIRADFETEYGKYEIYPSHDDGPDVVEDYARVARCRRDMARLLDERFDWDLLAVQFQVTDTVYHDLDDRERIRRVLQAVDSYVGDIVALGDAETAVFVVSDHGMGDYTWSFYVNSWLADNGYCQTATGDTEYFSSKKQELRNEANSGRKSNVTTRLIERTADGLSAIGVTPRTVLRALTTIGLAEPIKRVLPNESLRAAQNRTVDWARSEAFQIYFNSLGVHINVEGREPSGRVPQDRYDEFREELMEELGTITDPHGNRVFDTVKPREEVYHGSNATLAPDIVLVPREYEYNINGSILEPFQRNAQKNHKPDGIFIANRPTADDVDLQRASIYDVAPTIAACLGFPPDAETDGEVLPVTSETDEPEPWHAIADTAWSASIRGSHRDEDVEQRLADLGYME